MKISGMYLSASVNKRKGEDKRDVCFQHLKTNGGKETYRRLHVDFRRVNGYIAQHRHTNAKTMGFLGGNPKGHGLNASAFGSCKNPRYFIS